MGKNNGNGSANRTGLEKVQSAWAQVGVLMKGRQWSAAVARAASALKTALSIASTCERRKRPHLEPDLVVHRLGCDNDMTGSVDKLLRMVTTSAEGREKAKRLRDIATRIDEQRNLVIQTGAHMTEDEAKEIVGLSKALAERSVQFCHPEFFLTAPSK
jgi:hypothetical protein